MKLWTLESVRSTWLWQKRGRSRCCLTARHFVETFWPLVTFINSDTLIYHKVQCMWVNLFVTGKLGCLRPISHCHEYSWQMFVGSTRSEYSQRVSKKLILIMDELPSAYLLFSYSCECVSTSLQIQVYWFVAKRLKYKINIKHKWNTVRRKSGSRAG